MYTFIVAFIGLIFTLQSYAFVFHQNGKSGFDHLQHGDYDGYKPYSSNSVINPYSTYNSPYNPKSIWLNSQRYAEPVKNFKGQYMGQINQHVTRAHSVTNPYGQYGNVYHNTHIGQPYRPDNANNPYSEFQNPYHPNSARNNPKYKEHFYDSNGRFIGYGPSNTYNNNAVTNPYRHSPYQEGNLQHPYSKNKSLRIGY